MSNKNLIIAERSRSIGNFKVGRILPFLSKRMVGPFIFIDHMGPTYVEPGNYMDVGQHPHVGLSTLTYLIAGQVEHTDSTGAHHIIQPGSVNWMTAGKGVVHTERTPESLKDGNAHEMHGYQIWVALPKDKENIEPSFFHAAANDLPNWQEGSVRYKLVAGEGYGRQSPVPVYSKLFMIELNSKEASHINTADNLYGEIGICVVSGSIEIDGEIIEEGNMLVSNSDDTCCFKIGDNSKVFLFGGEPFEEPRLIHWNFVASNDEILEAAKANWINKAFKMIPGDDSYIALPNMPFKDKK
ncbi:pirin family protein [Crocinitomix catalasitica]|uniref:pirin family protein n=1 Tax=Crocinitomix catalasitica TaxID=184607 RepID=UPI0004802AF4|nr:pirin family protein [Crocinitomix catalasitica]